MTELLLFVGLLCGVMSIAEGGRVALAWLQRRHIAAMVRRRVEGDWQAAERLRLRALKGRNGNARRE